MDKPKILSTDIAHENPWYRVRHDKLVWPSGKPGDYYVVEFPPAVIVVAEQDGNMLVIDQYRHATDQVALEFPGGRADKNEDPETSARRELAEETGYGAETLIRLGALQVLSGTTNLLMHVFAAEGLTPSLQTLDDSEHGLNVQWMPVEEWRRLIRTNIVSDSETVAAWALYQEWKNKK